MTPPAAVIGVPVPAAPGESIQYSAAVMVDASLRLELMVGEATLGFGLTVTELTTGPVVSFTKVWETASPQLPEASLASTETVWVPSARLA